MTNLEAQFEAALREGCRISIEDYNCRPTYFLQMMDEYGGVGAAQRLLARNEPQAGLTTLWEFGRLDLTVEAYVVRPEYAELFTGQQIAEAKRRLMEYDYDFD